VRNTSAKNFFAFIFFAVMSLSEQLDEVFELLKSGGGENVILRAFDVFAQFPEELVSDFLRREDCENAKVIVNVFASMQKVNIGMLESLVMLAGNERCAEIAAGNEKVVRKLYSLAAHGDPIRFVEALLQVSRMAPVTLHEQLFKLNGDYFKLLTGNS
jgi:hypothetical protein